MNTSYCAYIHLYTWSFRIKYVNSCVILEYPFMNLRLKLTIPKNDCNSLIFVGTSYSTITFTFSKSIYIPFILIIYPRNWTSFLWNAHFSNSNFISLLDNLSRIPLTSFRYYRYIFKYIRILSKYIITFLSRSSYKISFTRL